MLDNDIEELDIQLGKRLPWLATLSPARQQVLMNMAFNLGIDGLLGFKNTLGMIASGDYQKAADAMMQSKWAGQVGDRAKRLAAMMKEG